MTRQQVRMSWGRPAAKDSGDHKGTLFERWKYESHNLYFDDMELKYIEEK
jgi:hypothetical protein